MTEEAKKRKKEYVADYQRRIYKNISFKFRIKEDRAVLNYLASLDNKSEYIKTLILDDMKRTA